MSTDAKEFFDGEIHLLETLIEEAASLKDNDLKLQLFVNDVIGKIQHSHPGEKGIDIYGVSYHSAVFA
ncbi:hypothetical protein ACFS4T_22865 [Pseudomonas lini]